MSQVEQFVAFRLNNLGLDGEVLASYFMGYLAESGTESAEILYGMLCDYGVDPEPASALVASICDIYTRGYLQPDELEALTKPFNHVASLGQAYESGPESLPTPPSELEHGEEINTAFFEGLLEDEPDSRADAEPEAEAAALAFGDYEDDSQFIDYVSLLDSVDSFLQSAYQCYQSYAPNAVLSALAACGYDVQQTAHLLITASEQLKDCKPCRHLMQGGCYRRDCMFEHQLGSYLCRYWLVGECKSIGTAACLFQHDFMHLAASMQQVVQPMPMDMLFPSLSSKKASHSAYSNGTGGGYAKALAKPSVPASAPTLHGAWTNKNTNPSQSTYGHTVVIDKAGFADSLKELNFVASNKSNQQASAAAFSRDQLKVNAHDWVASGDSLLVEYSKLREEAQLLSSSRVRLFEEAANAYVGGSKDLARSLSQQAQRLSERMHSCQLEAGKSLFRRRNTVQSLQSGTVDLHGLHVAEGRSCLYELLPLYRKLGLKSIKVITGTGHHSLHGKAKLLPAVQELIDEQGYTSRVVKDAGGYGGALLVTLCG